MCVCISRKNHSDIKIEGFLCISSVSAKERSPRLLASCPAIYRRPSNLQPNPWFSVPTVPTVPIHQKPFNTELKLGPRTQLPNCISTVPLGPWM